VCYSSKIVQLNFNYFLLLQMNVARVEVSLMASKIGLPDLKTQKADEAAYIVDEGSDDD
jgi:hypothetical protein